MTTKVLGSGRSLKQIMRTGTPALTIAERSAFREFAGKVERYFLTQMGSNGQAYVPTLGRFVRYPTNPSGGNVAGHREIGSKAARSVARRSIKRVMAAAAPAPGRS